MTPGSSATNHASCSTGPVAPTTPNPPPDRDFRFTTGFLPPGIRHQPDSPSMTTQSVPVDRPVFVLGERTAATALVRALGDTPTLCAMPANRLLSDLVHALDRCSPDLKPLTDPAHGGL